MAFDPAHHGFLKLDFTFPGGVTIHERELEGIDQRQHDTLRLNSYLTQDGDFVTVWYGLLDAHMTEMSLGFDHDPTFDFTEQYDEPLFRGYIGDDQSGAVILKALRLEHRTPSKLLVPKRGQVECHAL